MWSYRIGTRHVFYDEETKKATGKSGERLFHIMEVHYEADNVTPKAYGIKDILLNWHSTEELNEVVFIKLPQAFLLPVLDLDMWPQVYNPPPPEPKKPNTKIKAAKKSASKKGTNKQAPKTKRIKKKKK